MPRQPRILFLARAAMGLSVVREAWRFTVVFLLIATCGFAVALTALAPTSGNPGPLGPLAAGIFAAALGAGWLDLLSRRSARRSQATEFARLARRLGEEKTARSEQSIGLRGLAAAIERSLPEIFGQDDDSEGGYEDARPLGGPGNGGGLGPEKQFGAMGGVAAAQDPWRARRLRRIAYAAALFGGTDLELKPIALAGPCAEVIEEYRRLAGPDCEIVYIEDGGGNWLTAPVNRPLMVLALRELLDNVLAHGGGWGRATVTTEPVPGAIVLRVRDDGRGISSEQLDAIVSNSPAAARTGLGLPLVRAIIEAHGGQFRIDSDAGRGTVVTLRFPTHVES